MRGSTAPMRALSPCLSRAVAVLWVYALAVLLPLYPSFVEAAVRRLAPLLVMILVASASPSRSAPQQINVGYFGPEALLVNFDRTPDGTPIADQQPLTSLYTAWGVTFGPSVVATSTDGIATSLPNRAMCGAGSERGLLPIDCYFPAGVAAVGAYGFDFVLDVFDQADAFIYRVSYTDGTAGLFGGAAELGFLGIASDTPIYHARFSRYWTNQAIYGYEIDDLRFVGNTATPTASQSWGRLKARYR
jgi:hypothetical protein